MSDRYDEEKRREYNRQYRQKNKERIDELMKKWHKENPDKNKTYKRKYRAENKDTLNEKNREYYHRTIEKQRERSKLYAKNNPEKGLERTKKWNKKNNIINPERAMLMRTKARAKRRGIDFNITLKDIVIPTHCPIFGLPLFPSTTGKKSDNSPSLDRIDSSKGYTKSNIIVISEKANNIKNCGTPDEHIKIGLFFKKYDYDFSLEETIEKLSERYDYQ